MGLFEFVVGEWTCCSRRINQTDGSIHIKLNYL